MADWAKEWQDISNKPLGIIQDKKYKTKPGRDEILAAMLGISNGVKSQDDCDPNKAPRGSMATEKDNIGIRNEKFSKNIAIFKKDGVKMTSALKKMLENADKGTEPDLYRNLKILITGVDAFAARMAQHGKTWASNADDNESWDDVNAVKNPEDQKLAKEIRALEISLRDIKVSLNSSLKKALAAAQKIKANPTPANYNTEIDKGGRDLYMSLTAINKIKLDKVVGKHSKAKKIPEPGAMLNAIKQFGEGAGNYRTLPPILTGVQVLVVLKQFTDTVKLIAVSYAKFLKE